MTALYSRNGSYPAPLPDMIVLATGEQRTDAATFTAAEIASAGYVPVLPAPNADHVWTGSGWRSMTQAELAARAESLRLARLADIRGQRNAKLDATDKIVTRHRDQIELGVTPTLDAATYTALLAYRQELRDITETFASNPEAVLWPSSPV